MEEEELLKRDGRGQERSEEIDGQERTWREEEE